MSKDDDVMALLPDFAKAWPDGQKSVLISAAFHCLEVAMAAAIRGKVALGHDGVAELGYVVDRIERHIVGDRDIEPAFDEPWRVVLSARFRR